MLVTTNHDAVREIRLARPPANALDPTLIAALHQAHTDAVRDGVRALVLAGSPGMFSGGLDVPVLIQLDRPAMAQLWNDFYALLRALAQSPLPIVAAVTGHSPAGGAVLAIQCDRRVMAAGEFRIGLNEVRVGLPMPPVIYQVAARLVGPAVAERLCVAGELVPAEEALRLGLVDELAPAEQVTARALELAQDLASLPPQALKMTRDLARADLRGLYAPNFDAEVDGMLDAWFGAEAQGSMRALLERLAKRRAG